jgi:ferredoxin-like protein FixX
MSRVLLISSNPENTTPEDTFDLYVHFNSCIHFDKTPVDKSMIMVRSRELCATTEGKNCHSVCPNLCYKSIGSCSHDCKVSGNPKVICVVGLENFMDNNVEVIDLNGLNDFYYPEGKSPTTGFIAIKYFLKLNYDVGVLGFDLEKAPYRNSRSHDIDYEIEEVNKMIFAKQIVSV